MFSINPVVCSDSQGTGSCSSPSEGCWVPSPVQAAGASSGLLGDLSRGIPVLFLCSCFSYVQTFSCLVFFLFNVPCCGHKAERLGSGHFSRTQLCPLASTCVVTCIQKSAQMTNPGHFQKPNSPHPQVSS